MTDTTGRVAADTCEQKDEDPIRAGDTCAQKDPIQACDTCEHKDKDPIQAGGMCEQKAKDPIQAKVLIKTTTRTAAWAQGQEEPQEQEDLVRLGEQQHRRRSVP